MTQIGNVRITPSKIQQILEAGRRQLSPEEFEELTNLLFDLQVYGLTPWINVKLGTLMSKIEWELELEPSPEWHEALQACDRAFSGKELKAICYEVGASPVGHKKELCARLYRYEVPEVVAVMEPYLKELTTEQIEEEVERYALVLPQIEKESDIGPDYELGDSYSVLDDAVREALRLRQSTGCMVRITETETPQGKRFQVWVSHKREIIFPQTGLIWRSRLREVKDRLEELRRTAPEEFYHRKGLFEQAIREREKGKQELMPQFTLDELRELLKFTESLYR